MEHDVPGLEPLHDLGDFQIEDLDQVRFGQSAEDNHIVEPVEELGTEGLFGVVHDLIAHLFVAVLIADGGEAQG